MSVLEWQHHFLQEYLQYRLRTWTSDSLYLAFLWTSVDPSAHKCIEWSCAQLTTFGFSAVIQAVLPSFILPSSFPLALQHTFLYVICKWKQVDCVCRVLPSSYIRSNKLSSVCLKSPHKKIVSKTQLSFLFLHISFSVLLLRRRRRHHHRHHHHHHHHFTNACHHSHKLVTVPLIYYYY